MEISNFFAVSLISFGAIISFDLPAKAAYIYTSTTCSTDYFGIETCYGSNNDEDFEITPHTDYFGNKTIEGTAGGESFIQSCSDDYFGNTSCY